MLKITLWSNYLSGGDWSDAADWTNGVPTANSLAEVGYWSSAYPYTVTISSPAFVNQLQFFAPVATIADAAALYIASGGSLETVNVFELQQGGSINGGTVVTSQGTYLWQGGALNNVTVSGPLDLSAANAQLYVTNLIPQNVAGYNLPIEVTGVASTLTFFGAQTVADATITLGASVPYGQAPPTLLFQAPSAGNALLTFAATTNLTVQESAQINQAGNQLAAILDRGSTLVADGANLLLNSHFVNYGSLSLGSTGDSTILRVGAIGYFLAASLINRGVMTLTDSAANLIAGSFAPIDIPVFQNLATLSGAGAIGVGDGSLTFVNGGMVDANGANALRLDTGKSEVNGGTIVTSGQGGLVIDDAIFNANGHIHAIDGSGITLGGGAYVSDGALSLGTGSVLEAGSGGSSALLGVNITNGGLIEADDDTTLTLDSGAIVMGGVVEALDASTLLLGTVTFSGATLTSELGGGFGMLSDATATLHNVTLSAGADLIGQSGDALLLSGTIALQSSAGVQAEIQTGDEDIAPPNPGQSWVTGVGVSGLTTLAGGGVLQLGDGVSTAGQLFASSNAWLINQDTIQGAGNIADDELTAVNGSPYTSTAHMLGLINHGTIDASTAYHSLSIETSQTINNIGGLLEATDGGYLAIGNEVVGGAISIGAQSFVGIERVSGAAISFDDSLGDSGGLQIGVTSLLVNDTISGFYADGLGDSDTIYFSNPIVSEDPVGWTFHENAAGTAGTLTVSDSLTHQAIGSLVLQGQYLDAGMSASSATSTLFHTIGFPGVVSITTTALERLTS